MRVRLLVSRSGPSGSQVRGDVIAVSDEEAKRMMEAQPPQAEPIRDAPPPERAAARRPRRRSGKAAK